MLPSGVVRMARQPARRQGTQCTVNLEDQSRPGEGGSEKTIAAVNTSLPNGADNRPDYVVLMITRYGIPRRRVYLDLGAARAAVARARGKGQQAWLVLCELTPVAADLGSEAES
jgi:hypothetical protein